MARIVQTGRARTVDGLVKSLAGGNISAEALEQAKNRLLDANPSLVEEAALKPGMQIIVPRFGQAGEEPRDEGAANAAPTAAQSARAGVEALMARMGREAETSIAASKEKVRLLSVKKTQDRILTLRPNLKGQLEAVGKAGEEKGKRLQAVREDLSARLSRLAKQLPGTAPDGGGDAKKG